MHGNANWCGCIFFSWRLDLGKADMTPQCNITDSRENIVTLSWNETQATYGKHTIHLTSIALT